MLKITYILNYKKGNALLDIRKDTMELLGHLTNVSKISGFVNPRLYLLKAYMSLIRGRTTKAKKLIAIALKNARQQGNYLMQASIELHKKVPRNQIPYKHKNNNFSFRFPRNYFQSSLLSTSK